MASKTISIASDFSKFPGGRWRKDGPNSGEQFREEILIPALLGVSDDPAGKVIVNIDGVAGYGSSFLEESFGGIVRVGKVDRKTIAQKLEIQSKDPIFAGYHRDALRYLRDALRAAEAA